MKFELKFGHWRTAFSVFLLCAPLLAACAKSAVPVPIHGVNHRADAFSYVLVDPTNAENTGGGEVIEPFSAGGSMCCYTLPMKWRPGIKVEVRETHWLPKRPDNSLPEVTKKHIVDIPAYVSGEAGELWVIRMPDGDIDVVSSNYQPDHVKWPGKIKGWPVPSLEYQRERQDMYIKDAQDAVELFISGLDELNKNPAAHAREVWDVTAANVPRELKGFSGPNDAAYLIMLKNRYESSLVLARERLAREKAGRALPE